MPGKLPHHPLPADVVKHQLPEAFVALFCASNVSPQHFVWLQFLHAQNTTYFLHISLISLSLPALYEDCYAHLMGQQKHRGSARTSCFRNLIKSTVLCLFDPQLQIQRCKYRMELVTALLNKIHIFPFSILENSTKQISMLFKTLKKPKPIMFWQVN